MTGVHLVLTGDDLPIPYGILPVSQDEHALAVDRVRFVGDPVALVVARDELTAGEALDLIDVEYEPLRTFADPIDSLTRDEPRIHDYAARGNVHKVVALAFGDVRAGPRRGGSRLRRRVLLPGQHAPADRAARGGGGARSATASSCSGRARRRRTTSIARSPRRWRCRRRTSASSPRPTAAASAARAIRSTTRSWSPRRRCLLDRPVKICLNREEVFYCHRGRHPVLMRFRTGVKQDGTITGGASPDAARRRRLRIVRRREHVLHRRAADRDRITSRATGSAAAACSRTSRRADRSAATARRRAASARRCSSTRSRSALGSIRPTAPADRRAAGHADRQLSARRTIGLAECIRRVVGAPDWRARVPQAAARPRRRARVLVLSLRRRPADLLERHAALGRAAQARSQRRRDGRSAAPRRSARDRTMCWWRASRRCSASIRSTSAPSPATPI